MNLRSPRRSSAVRFLAALVAILGAISLVLLAGTTDASAARKSRKSARAQALAAGATVDLTGEICLSGSTVIDPDANGPLPGLTYCVMNGRLATGDALEMDDIDGLPPVSGAAASVVDGNLFKGADAANDPDLPFIAGASYIDWDDLAIANLTGAGAAPLGSVENHRILDFTANDDFTTLRPQAASCMNSGSSLPKEDFTESFIANNDQFLYLAQERRTNNGNSVYYWLLTKKAPIVVETSDCGLGNTRGQLQFNLTAGDVELLVNFPDSSDPAGGGVFFRAFTGAETGYIPARDAVFDAGWGGLQTAPVMNIAVNIAGDGDDAYGHWGGINSHGAPVATGTYATATFAEWAVDLEDLFGGLATCGQSLFITGLSRASTGQIGSIDEPAALKDVVGPKVYSFGQISATATVTGTCEDPAVGDSFSYSAAAFGLDGVTPLDPSAFSCSWVCDDDGGRTVTLSNPNACSGTGDVSEGGRTPVNVTCTVTVTETASGCAADDDATDEVLFPILVSIAPTPTALSCTVPGSPGSDNGTIGDGVAFLPGISGGDGSYSLTWTVSGPNEAVCGLNDPMCVVDIPDSLFCALTRVSVAVDDGSPLCAAKASETETVTKATTIGASNN